MRVVQLTNVLWMFHVGPLPLSHVGQKTALQSQKGD
jgi:hypothetical protein